MAEADSKDEITPAASPEAQGEDFAQMLDAEGVPTAPATHEVAVGDEVSGVIVKIEDENSFVEYGSRDEAIIRTSELNGPMGKCATRSATQSRRLSWPPGMRSSSAMG